jgi:hypothetical protein
MRILGQGIYTGLQQSSSFLQLVFSIVLRLFRQGMVKLLFGDDLPTFPNTNEL